MEADVDSRLQQYVDLIGYVPAGIHARLTLLGELDPDFLDRLERRRGESVEPSHLPHLTVQLLQYAILLFARDEDALAHARIALRMGAGPQELLDVIRVAGWLGGAPAYNMGFRTLQDALEHEAA